VFSICGLPSRIFEQGCRAQGHFRSEKIEPIEARKCHFLHFLTAKMLRKIALNWFWSAVYLDDLMGAKIASK
jgi:hypothetical protein